MGIDIHAVKNKYEKLDFSGVFEKFEERTLFRTLETIGKNREEIISDIQDRLFHNFEHTDVNLDWTRAARAPPNSA